MKIFADPRWRRVFRLIGSPLALIAALWHFLHTWSMWQQMEQYKTSDPALSGFFYAKFQTELAVTLAAFLAGVFAWHMFKPQEADTGQEVSGIAKS